jgi:hypothetical protein
LGELLGKGCVGGRKKVGGRKGRKAEWGCVCVCGGGEWRS